MKPTQIFFIISAFALGLLSCQATKSKPKTNPAQSAAVPETLLEQTPHFQMVDWDASAGETLFRKGNAAGVPACVTCHGSSGEGQPAAGNPRLAEQSRLYLLTQLRNYKTSARQNPVMQPIAQALSEQEMQNVSAYIEQLTSDQFPKAMHMSARELRRAQQIAKVGDGKIGLQACNNCHGAAGKGQAPNIPALYGQSSVFLQKQLQDWKSGTRKSSADHMGYIANLLSDSDIKALSDYFQSRAQ